MPESSLCADEPLYELPSSPFSMGKRGRRLWIALGLLLGCPCLLTGLGLVALKISFARTAGTLPGELAAARASRIPTEISDLRRMAYVPERDNAAPLYRQALALYERVPRDKGLDDATYHYSQGTASPTDVKLLRDQIDRLSKCLEVALRASKLPGLCWDRRWEDAFRLPFPEYGWLKSIEKILLLRARFEANTGQIDLALRDVDGALRMAVHADQEPTVIGYLVRVSMEATALSTLEAVLNRPATPSQLAFASEMISKLGYAPNPRLALEGELITERQDIKIVRSASDLLPGTDLTGDPIDSGNESGIGSAPIDWLLRNPSFREAWDAKTVHYLRILIDAIPKERPTWSESRAAIEAYDRAVANDNSIENKFNQLIAPVLLGLADAYARVEANQRMMAVSIAVLKIRRETGHVPARLPDLGETSIDPFNLKQLGYKRIGNGFKVYSVDSDLVDDGGLTRREDKHAKSRTHDIAWSFK